MCTYARGLIESLQRSRTQKVHEERGEGVLLCEVRGNLWLNSARGEQQLHETRGIGNLIVVSKYLA